MHKLVAADTFVKAAGGAILAIRAYHRAAFPADARFTPNVATRSLFRQLNPSVRERAQVYVGVFPFRHAFI